MSALLALGINHKTAPLSVRERIAFSADNIDTALIDLTAQQGVNESAILSTCHRTEIYCSLSDSKRDNLLDWLSDFHCIKKPEIQPYVYTYPNAQAVQHMLRVASGLDSMVLGEPQILGQLKTAYQQAVDANSIGKLLGKLFQHSFRSAKQIRSHTAIGHHPVSIAYASIRLAQQILGDLAGCRALLIGAGDTIKIVGQHLQDKKLAQITLANRNLERGLSLAHTLDAKSISLEQVPIYLAQADIVFSATSSPLPILGKGAVEAALKRRKQKPIFIVDLAMPRDVEPQVGNLNDAYLYTIDDLQTVVRDNQQNRQQAAQQAEIMINSQVNEFMDWIKTTKNGLLIKDFRDKAEIFREEVLRNAAGQLARGGDPIAILDAASKKLTQRLLHRPSVMLRQKNNLDQKTLQGLINELYGLDE